MDFSNHPDRRHRLAESFHTPCSQESTSMEIPVTLVGKTPALELRTNVLMQELHALTVECLPANSYLGGAS